MPEAQPQAFKSIYWLKEYAKLYGYDVPVTSCYEWRGRRTTPGNLTEKERAELITRDLLHALPPYRMPNINLGLLHDGGDSYYYSRWGGTGLCHRYPLINPKISYVAVSTLTRELDSAQFTRCLKSNSPSLYITGFERDDGYAYTLWLPHGERRVKLTFERDIEFRVVDMIGNSRTLRTKKKGATLLVSSSPCYLHSSATITGTVGAPTRCEPPAYRVTRIERMNDIDRWSPENEPDEYLEKTHFDFPRKPGKSELKLVKDRERGKVLELKLLPQLELSPYRPRYIALRAEPPIPVPGKPKAIGMWVKGNSCWGRIMWEFEDAKGERFFSIGAPCGGWSVGDWKSRTFINFDGWNYLQVRLLTRYESGFYGPERRNWLYSDGDGRVEFPIKFTRLVIEMRDSVVHLTDLLPIPRTDIRFADLGVSYG